MRRLLAMLIGALAVAAVLSVLPAQAATLNATPSTLATAYGNAQAGDTIVLLAGSYRTWVGGSKAITLKAADGATVTMGVDFTTGDQGLTLEGLKIPGGNITNGARDITIRDSAFTSSLTIDGVANANILLERDTFNNINSCSTCTPARLHLSYGSDTPSGVTVRDSKFIGGSADGIQAGTGLSIIGNEFAGIREGSCTACHTDAIQLIGARGSVVQGNWLHDNQDGITAFDGLDNATVVDNAIGPQQSDADCIDMYALQGSLIAHNSCTSGMDIWLDHKDVDPASRGNTIRDNFAPAGLNGRDIASNARTANLASPVYQGGSAPAAYDGFRLSALSAGLSGASDGLNVGVRFQAVNPDPSPTPTPTPTASPTATPTPAPTATPSPAPAYHPACEPTCDEQIAAIGADLAQHIQQRDALAAQVAQLQLSVEALAAQRDEAQHIADERAVRIAAAVAALQ